MIDLPRLISDFKAPELPSRLPLRLATLADLALKRPSQIILEPRHRPLVPLDHRLDAPILEVPHKPRQLMPTSQGGGRRPKTDPLYPTREQQRPSRHHRLQNFALEDSQPLQPCAQAIMCSRQCRRNGRAPSVAVAAVRRHGDNGVQENQAGTEQTPQAGAASEGQAPRSTQGRRIEEVIAASQPGQSFRASTRTECGCVAGVLGASISRMPLRWVAAMRSASTGPGNSTSRRNAP